MNINKDKLVKFLDYIVLTNKIENSQAIINISNEQITSLARLPNKVGGLKATIKGDFEELGELGVHDLKLFRDSLKSFDEEEVILGLEKNKIVFTNEKGKHKVKILLRNKDYILNKIDEEGFDKYREMTKGNEFTLVEEDVKKVISYYNAIKSDEVILVGKGNEIALKLEKDENEIIDSFEVGEVGDFKTKVSKIFIDLISVLKGDITLSIMSDKPIFVSVDDEDSKFEYVLAPLK